MNMTHAIHILFQHGQRILAGEGKVAGIIAQEYIAGIRVGHHAVRFLAGLHHGTHVVVEAQLEAPLGGDLPQTVQPLAETIPLRVVHHVLMTAGEDRHVNFSLNGVTLLGDIDAVGAHSLQKVQIGNEILFFLLHGAGQNEGRIPAAGDPHSPQIQRLFQHNGIGGILVSDLAAGEAGQRPFR